VALHPYRTLSEAIALANDTDYGLNASVWGSDIKRATEVALQLEAGNVNVNEGFAAAYASKGTPSGGVKQSGVGARHGDNGLLKYTDVQNLAVVKKQVMGVQPGQTYEKYAATTLKSLAIMRKTGIR
jgi:aldehyde dehydrogenase (NAD+)/succinate-semialdehyde dehydrogenase/glutarate-semialdehyde dehydrogenase